MPGAEYGFKAAIIGLVTGFITSAAVNTVSLKLDTSGNYIVAIFNLFAIISMLMQFEKMNYWSLSYSLGYFVGVSLWASLHGKLGANIIFDGNFYLYSAENIEKDWSIEKLLNMVFLLRLKVPCGICAKYTEELKRKLEKFLAENKFFEPIL